MISSWSFLFLHIEIENVVVVGIQKRKLSERISGDWWIMHTITNKRLAAAGYFEVLSYSSLCTYVIEPPYIERCVWW